VPIGNLAYEIEASKTGFTNATKTNITVTVGIATNVGVIFLVPTAAQPGKISGQVIDANNGTVISGAMVKIYDWSGALMETLTTNASNPNFTSSQRQPGSYTLAISKIGYFDLTMDNINVDGNVSVGKASMSEILTEPHVRVVVQWGPTPSDFDLHCVGPTNRTVADDGTPNSRFHVYWSGQKSFNENKTASPWYSGTGDPSGTSSTTSLVQDTTTGYGPEAINLFGFGSGYARGVYSFTVHKWTDWHGGSWYDYPVTMRIFDSQGLVMQLSLPSGAGSGSSELRFWKAVKIDCQGPARSQRSITVENSFGNLTYNSKSSMNW
jgi:hypothetical protein